MSWSIDCVGTKESVSKAVSSELDKCAKNYEGKEEGRDILACKERALAAVAQLDTHSAPDGSDVLVRVKAYGSASSWSVSFNLSIERIVYLK